MCPQINSMYLKLGRKTRAEQLLSYKKADEINGIDVTSAQ